MSVSSAGAATGQSLLLTNVGELVTNCPDGGPPRLGELGVLTDAAMVIDEGRVAWLGPAGRAPAADRRGDVAGRAVLPGFVDSHAHLVFAGDRAAEFAARMAGQPYAAGGIATTVAATRCATDDQLRANVARLARELARSGVTTFESKSGYGLNVTDEARSVRIAREFTPEVTFLGAHVVPPEFAADRDGYLEFVTGPMLAATAPHCRWIDVFCERGAFDPVEARFVLGRGAAAGLVPRIHANQLHAGGAIRVAVEVGAASADHCSHLTDSDVSLLAAAAPTPTEPGTVATLLPGAEFGTRAAFPDASRLIAAGAVVALATDCNPGTSYTTSIPFCISLAVREMRLTPAQAVWAATAGGAIALRRPELGVLAVGHPADLVVLAAPSHVHLAYRPGVDLIDSVYRGGERVAGGADGR